jgi:uridine phosphorylase
MFRILLFNAEMGGAAVVSVAAIRGAQAACVPET